MEEERNPQRQAAEAGSGAEEGAGEKLKPHERILRSRSFVPIVVVCGLILTVTLASRLTGRPPLIDSITPRTGKPGDVMIITGRYFGQDRSGGEVRFSGLAPTSSEYSEWTDSRISVTIPEEAGSGLVHVVTRNGKSRGILFVNRDQMPVVVTSASKPGEPYINSIQPQAARIGDTITISGMNFGLERGTSRVYFTWTASADASAAGGFDLANLLPASDYNFDYASWSDREVVLHVPDGAASGNVLVTSDKGRSNSVYFEVLGGAGTKFFSSPRKYSVQYGMDITVAAATPENTLYVWMPQVLQTPEQRKIQLISRDPEPMLEDTVGSTLFSFANLQKGGKARIDLAWMLDRYSVETQVSASKVPLTYDTTTALYKRFTNQDTLAPAPSADVMKTLTAVIQGDKNPYSRARKIYEWLLSQLSYSDTASGESEPSAILKAKSGDAFAYSSLYCSALRAVGIPARMVAGYLVDDAAAGTRRHFWDEFYIETFGWVPVDPLLADEQNLAPRPGGEDLDLRAYYFGNLDNRHVTFTKGLGVVNQMNPEGIPKRHRELPYLLTIQEEAVGGLASYTASFLDLQVTGTY